MTFDEEAWKFRIDNLIAGVDENIGMLESRNERLAALVASLRDVVAASHNAILAGGVYQRELEDQVASLTREVAALRAGGSSP